MVSKIHILFISVYSEHSVVGHLPFLRAMDGMWE